MRILHVNKFLYRRGGAESYMLDVASLQAIRGHDVALFGMQHPSNPPLPLADHFPSFVELDPAPSAPVARARAAARMVWSTSSRRGMRGVIEEWEPDVVHLHNVYHQLSPSILHALRATSIPVVMTMHDYKLACPSYRLLDHGAPCTACLDGGLRQAVKRRCKDGSLVSSTLLAGESWFHRLIRAYDRVDWFVSPSRFLADIMHRAGLPDERLVVIPHPISTDGVAEKAAPGGEMLFAGRLSPEKGLDLLLDAVARAPSIRLRVAGEGPSEAALRAHADDVAPGRVQFLGRLEKDEMRQEMLHACAVVVPSQWYENQPMTVLEAFACGVPVIATDIGGLPELVRDGHDGLIVAPGDVDALAAALAALDANPTGALAMGRNGRAKVTGDFTPDSHLDALDGLYATTRAPRFGTRAS